MGIPIQNSMSNYHVQGISKHSNSIDLLVVRTEHFITHKSKDSQRKQIKSISDAYLTGSQIPIHAADEAGGSRSFVFDFVGSQVEFWVVHILYHTAQAYQSVGS